MNFLSQYRVPLLFSVAAAVLVAALFWPEPKKPGEMQKYYSIPQAQLDRIEYAGEMTLAEKNKVRVEYAIIREANPLKPKEPLYRIEVKNLTSTDAKLAKRVAELRRVKTFYASALVRTIVQDWAELDYFYALRHDAARDQEYGVKDCGNKLTLVFRSHTKLFCVGAATQGETRHYLIDTVKDKLLITPDYTVRRLTNNIFAQREQSLHPHGADGDLIEIQVLPPILAKLPLLREKTSGQMKLRMLLKDEGQNKINVWHVENRLEIKPSHAAELAQLMIALRVNAPYTFDALARERSLQDIISSTGPGVAASGIQGPGVTGTVKIRKTDQQDTLLTAFAFFPPGVKPSTALPWQFENQLVRPLDTLVVSHFNAGLISADIYPRLTAILTKFENDLLEARQKAEQEKKEKNQKATPPK